ncbi:MAG TPA: hypothetical protein VF093_00430 [Solirubrobacterales bacterium]
MRRLTILLATVGALMLIPAAQAFAAANMKVNVTGPGSGEVISKNMSGPGSGIGTPPIVCTYNGVSASGVCENTPDEPLEESGTFVSALEAQPAPGSEFGGWKVQMGPFFGEFGEFGTTGCPASSLLAENPGPNPTHECRFQTINPGENEDHFEALATFCDEGTAKEEQVFNPIAGENETRLVGCGEGPAGPKLTVDKEGTGTGTVVSNPGGITCGGTCKTSFETNQKVTLTASPGTNSTFVSWKGCEKGGVNGRQCTVTMDKAKTVNAKFTAAYYVKVNREGSGLGKVSSSPGGVLCLSNCTQTIASFKEGTSVTLSAAPSKNYVFTEWTGDYSGSSLTCSLGSLGADKTVGAKFSPVIQFNLGLTKSGGGNGTVKSNVAGINCGATCSSMTATYFEGTVVELTATPGKGSSFGGWSGSGCSGTGTCTVTMSKGSAVVAKFE